MPNYFLIFLCLVLSLNSFWAQPLLRYTPGNWKFRNAENQTWHKANVPGTIHTDLLSNKLIPDPFIGINENKVKWIEEKTWEYKTYLRATEEFKTYENAELVCEGLDTYADVYVNDSLILRADNMFRRWRKDIRKFIKQNDSNFIRIVFKPALAIAREAMKQLPYQLPGDERVFSRKAQYQYGWDFAPRLITAGIWKPLYIQFWNRARFEYVKVNQIRVDTNEALASVDAEIWCAEQGEYQIEFVSDWTPTFQKTTYLRKGVNYVSYPFKIPKPKLWWCHGQGDPHLYDLAINLKAKGSTLDQKNLKTGFRKIELVQDIDSTGRSFYFKLNGRPVFIKGANYIPFDNFLTRKPNYQIPQAAAEMNMNMLRVWGGGVYADEEFYNACDSLGIVVWQDFMFACAMYPGDSAFVNTVKEEITQQVKRISNHTSLALWCGNNEIDEGWHNWGWQKEMKYSKIDSLEIWSNYLNLFHNVIPALIKVNDPATPYWPSSPSIGWGRKESLVQGDSHYWGVWWGNEPFEIYTKRVGRFMSEYGFQGMPSVKTVEQFCEKEKPDMNSDIVKNHQKHPTGYQTIQTYLDRDFKIPTTFERYVYVSQLLQARGMKTAIEAHRNAKPYCMGTLFWQMNDCWPVTSWSSIDYYGRKKALYYEVKRLYKDLSINITKTNDFYYGHVTSEKQNTIEGELFVEVKTFSGKVLLDKVIKAKTAPDSSKTYTLFKEEELKTFSKSEIYLTCKFNTAGEEIRAHYYFVRPRELNLQKPALKMEWKNKTTLFVSSNTLVKDLYLYSESEELEISDNFFNLEAGEKKEVQILNSNNTSKLLKYISLYDINKAD